MTVTPVSWDFSAEFPGYASTSIAPEYWPTFQFTTDADGNISNWNITAYFPLAPQSLGGQFDQLTSTASGDAVSADYPNDDVGGPPMTIEGTSNTAGTWTCIASMTASHISPPAPPSVNPLAAQVASQAAELHSLQNYYLAVLAAYKAEIADLTAEVERLK
jgi:hypothetical protein